VPGMSATPLETRASTTAEDNTKVENLLDFRAFARFNPMEVRLAA